MPTFVSPMLLAGGLLIGIPIVLHLVMRQRPKHLEFPALRFLLQRREANRRRLRLRHVLLLLLRCAVILIFALALARPIFQSGGFLSGGQAPVAAALIVDTRPRMQYRHHNQTRLEVAKTLGRDVLQQLPMDSELVVLDAGSPRTRFDVDRGAAAQAIDQLEITYNTRGLLDMFDNAVRVLRDSDHERKEVFILTDMAAADWQASGALDRWRQRIEENPQMGIYLLDVGVQDIENFGLSRLNLSHEVLSENRLLTLDADVEHVGGGGERTVQLFLTGDDGQPEKKGEQTVSCGANGAAQVTFKTTVGGLGTQQGFVKFARPDNLAVDDVRYFTIRIHPPWQILVAAPEPAQTTARLLTGALAPPTLRRRGEAQYEFEIVAHKDLADQPLTQYDAVWILDPPPLSTSAWNRLSSFAAAGGGVAIALGGRAGLTGDHFNSTASLELLPAELKRQWKSYDLYLAPDRFEHPILATFKDREGEVPWDRNPVFKIWDLGPLTEGVHIVARFSNRRPAILARNVGRGRVVTLTTPLASSSRSPWNQLLAPREDAWPGFVLVNGITEYLVGSRVHRLNFEVGEAVQVALEAGGRAYPSYLLNTPTGTRRVKADETSASLWVATTDAPGQYRIEAGGRQGVRYGFSVNLLPEENRLERIEVDDLEAALADNSLPVVRSIEALRQSRKVAAARTQWEAYPWLIALLVLVVAAENLLSSLFYRKGSAAPERNETAAQPRSPETVGAT